MFQSLTGSIQTDEAKVQALKFQEFQSLTGSIQTITLLFLPLDKLRVSIPHRFDSNCTIHFFILFQKNCFNPSQVRFKHNRLGDLLFLKGSFQSLTGSIQTGHCDCGERVMHKFQSLTGSIQTKLELEKIGVNL